MDDLIAAIERLEAKLYSEERLIAYGYKEPMPDEATAAFIAYRATFKKERIDPLKIALADMLIAEHKKDGR